jgi:membrane protein implicated in regulation of membrane protease activity
MAFLIQLVTNLLIQFVFISIIAYVVYLVVDKWITRSIRVRQEQNQLLRELIKVIDNKK